MSADKPQPPLSLQFLFYLLRTGGDRETYLLGEHDVVDALSEL
jgi:hypothetical protein